jgi:hypothetical protein
MTKSLSLTPKRAKDLTQLLQIAQLELTQQLTERDWIIKSSLNDEFARLRSVAADLIGKLKE